MEISLVFPHQLFKKHPSIQKDRPVLLLEDPLFFGRDRHWPMRMHRQKLLLHRASMVEYAEELKREGVKCTVISCPRTPCDTVGLLEKEIPSNVQVIYAADPVDDVLRRRLTRFTRQRRISLRLSPSPNFLSPPSFLDSHFQGGRKPFMARFYEAQRKRMGLLLEKDGSPLGGKWSLDVENRRRLPRNAEVPEPNYPKIRPTVEKARAELAREFPESPGNDRLFCYPVTRTDAEKWLDGFLEWRLSQFGPYEDFISSAHGILFHSVLTPILNIGLLDPADVVNRTLDHASRNEVPLNSLEGFLRQVVGWREYMRAMYEFHGVEMRTRNFWNFDRPMPKAFYTGETGIEPVDHVIRSVLRTGYCHHIERLMVLGNFMLLCRIRPDDVYQWFMEMFVDSYDWVMVPNVYGMSQFADGGGFTTKPYLSGSNYIRKMSDLATGDWCELWDALFWSFISDHRSFFEGNPRLALITGNLDRMGKEQVKTHQRRAAEYLAKFEP